MESGRKLPESVRHRQHDDETAWDDQLFRQLSLPVPQSRRSRYVRYYNVTGPRHRQMPLGRPVDVDVVTNVSSSRISPIGFMTKKQKTYKNRAILKGLIVQHVMTHSVCQCVQYFYWKDTLNTTHLAVFRVGSISVFRFSVLSIRYVTHGCTVFVGLEPQPNLS